LLTKAFTTLLNGHLTPDIWGICDRADFEAESLLTNGFCAKNISDIYGVRLHLTDKYWLNKLPSGSIP